MAQSVMRAMRRVFRGFEMARHEAADGTTTAVWRITAKVEADELDGGWVAECLEFPGAVAQGETPEEALDNLADVVSDFVGLRARDRIDEMFKDHRPLDPHEPIAISL